MAQPGQLNYMPLLQFQLATWPTSKCGLELMRRIFKSLNSCEVEKKQVLEQKGTQFFK